MTVFLQIVFIFYLGSTFGWIIELFFRRIVHKKWVNPGFLIGPLFSVIWTIVGALYYYIIVENIINALDWFSENIAFSYILGIFTGLIIIDAFYSCKLYSKIKKYAKENNIIIKYEQLKIDIKEFQKSAREKYSFLNPFNQTKPLKNYLNLYKEKTKK